MNYTNETPQQDRSTMIPTVTPGDDVPVSHVEANNVSEDVEAASGDCDCPCHSPNYFVHHTAPCCANQNDSL